MRALNSLIAAGIFGSWENEFRKKSNLYLINLINPVLIFDGELGMYMYMLLLKTSCGVLKVDEEKMKKRDLENDSNKGRGIN